MCSWASADHGAGLTPTLAACRLARRAPPGPPLAGHHPFQTGCMLSGPPLSATSETYPVQTSCAAILANNKAH
eukprot:6278486-Heterocapsa_arctica.AAC.1